MRGKVICSTSKGPVEVPASLGTYLAVHHSLVSGRHQPRKSIDWTVTHIASGFAMEWCDTQAEARAFVKWAERDHGDELAILAALKFGKGPGRRGKIGGASKRLYAAREEYRRSVA
jgi:hypothetical protein